MPELFLELFSEEIPARMQARGAEDLARLVTESLAALAPTDMRSYAGPRRIALAARVNAVVPASRSSERGPRVSAPELALAGFLRKHGASRDALRQQGDFWVLERDVAGIDAASLIAQGLPGLLRKFPWPKSMRWGGSSRFTWVRPLRRILCVLDGRVVPFDLRDGEDDGHGLASSNLTEGHRFMAPGAFAVESETQWRERLFAHHVIVDAAERRRLVWDGMVAKAAEHGLRPVEDSGLLDEVAGLVEWPVPLLGRIDTGFMDLPPEVMQVSMRLNQRYFALRNADGDAAPWFAFAANISADDGGAAIVAGNERVLRARFSDARHFWDLDRTRTLESRVEDLRAVTFHAKLGTQYERALRIEALAGRIASALGGPDPSLARRAGLLCKADLVTGMVGEFPDLQGIMGAYYAEKDGEQFEIEDAIRDHYAPREQTDRVPGAPTSIAAAMADRLDQLQQFFNIGERPTGSGDPFALRRAALGVIRILRENQLRLKLLPLVQEMADVRDFIFERLRVQLRNEGERSDVLSAVLRSEDDDVVDVMARTTAVAGLLRSPAGPKLLTAFRRTANILREEEKKDGAIDPDYLQDQLLRGPELRLHSAIRELWPTIDSLMKRELYVPAMETFAKFKDPVDLFFDDITVNDPDPKLRRNRLGMLATLRELINRVADFSKIEG